MRNVPACFTPVQVAKPPRKQHARKRPVATSAAHQLFMGELHRACCCAKARQLGAAPCKQITNASRGLYACTHACGHQGGCCMHVSKAVKPKGTLPRRSTPQWHSGPALQQQCNVTAVVVVGSVLQGGSKRSRTRAHRLHSGQAGAIPAPPSRGVGEKVPPDKQQCLAGHPMRWAGKAVCARRHGHGRQPPLPLAPKEGVTGSSYPPSGLGARPRQVLQGGSRPDHRVPNAFGITCIHM